MLHTLIWTGKFIGIALAVFIGLLLLLLCLVLFVPVRYKAFIKKSDVTYGRGRISWFFSLVCVPIQYAEKEFSAKLKIFGIMVKDLMAEEEVKPKKPKVKKKKHRLLLLFMVTRAVGRNLQISTAIS